MRTNGRLYEHVPSAVDRTNPGRGHEGAQHPRPRLSRKSLRKRPRPRKLGFSVLQQHPIPVHYDSILVGDYIADLIVEDTVIIELKTARALSDEHSSICINYLHACKIPVCLLLNFGTKRLHIKRLHIKRLVGETYASAEDVI